MRCIKIYSAVLIAGLLSFPFPARAITINPTFDPSIAANLSPADAASWHTAIAYVDAQLHDLFTDPITINITFKANPGTSILGGSTYSEKGVGSIFKMATALTADAKSADDFTSAAHFPVTDPTFGSGFFATTAQAKALGLLAGDNSASDGTVSFGAGYTYSYDPNNRAVAGAFDFIGVVEHEITEVMGRAGSRNLGNDGALELLGYQFGPGGTGTGRFNDSDLQSNNYFTIDGGATPLKLFNDAHNGGDNKDWAAGTNDSFNAFSFAGVENGMSAIDIRLMDVIGYDLAVPEPSTLALAGLGLAGLIANRLRRFRSRAF